MERTDRRRALQVIERVLLAIAVIALGWYGAVSIIVKVDQASQDRTLDELRKDTPASAPVPTEQPAPPAPAPIAPPRPAPQSLVGRIDVPRLGLSAIVREGVDEGTLRRAVGHVPETALPGQEGNAALAAHRDTFFRPLKNIRKGDRVTFTTPDGVHEYRVAETRVVSAEDVSVLAPTPTPTLTLVTCYPFNFVGSAPKRFIVRAHASAATAAVAPPAPVVEELVPVKMAGVISESAVAAGAARLASRRPASAKAARTGTARGKAAVVKPAQKKAGPLRKFLQLFKGAPASTSPSRPSRHRR